MTVSSSQHRISTVRYVAGLAGVLCISRVLLICNWSIGVCTLPYRWALRADCVLRLCCCQTHTQSEVRDASCVQGSTGGTAAFSLRTPQTPLPHANTTEHPIPSHHTLFLSWSSTVWVAVGEIRLISFQIPPPPPSPKFLFEPLEVDMPSTTERDRF